MPFRRTILVLLVPAMLAPARGQLGSWSGYSHSGHAVTVYAGEAALRFVFYRPDVLRIDFLPTPATLSVPVLGSIPIIGPLFRRRTEVDRPRYLLVFVRATIVSETGEFIVFQPEER